VRHVSHLPRSIYWYHCCLLWDT